jgi:flagellar basal-body rod modification protein FlgD
MPLMGVPDHVKASSPFHALKMKSQEIKQETSNEDRMKENFINHFQKDNKNVLDKSDRSTVLKGPSQQLGKDEFVKMLTHQMKYQDPFAPQDPGKMTSEMAQFAQLEQLMNIEKSLSNQNKLNEIMPKIMAGQFIGKYVSSAGDKVSYDGESTDVKFQYDLPQEAHKVIIRILDSKGQMVHQDERSQQGQGVHEYSWNGNALNGLKALKGTYQLSLLSFDTDNRPLPVHTKVVGQVKGVSFENDMIMFDVNGKKIPLTGIDSLNSEPQAVHSSNQGPAKILNEPYLGNKNIKMPTNQKMIETYEKQNDFLGHP